MTPVRVAILVAITTLSCLVQFCQGAAPVFTDPDPSGSTILSYAEDTAVGTSIYSVAATDAEGDAITYSVTAQSPTSTPLKFTIVGQTLQVNDPLDYETHTSYTLTITASANGDTPTAVLTVQIQDVNDETPTLTGTYTATIDEELAVGTIIPSMFAATDADAGDTISYSISGSVTHFQIDSTTGDVSIKSVIDAETDGTSFTFTLTVTDSASTPHSVTQSLTVTVNNLNDNTPVFSPAAYYVTLAENTATGVSVQLLTVTDADAGTTLTITIASGDDASAKFQTNIGNNKLIETTGTAIDYESLGGSNYKYTLTVEASDGTNTGTATVFVTITGENEAAPAWGTFSPAWTSATAPFYISETAAIGTTIVTIAATDTDQGLDGEILYSLGTITADTGGVTSGLFYMDQVSGVLTTTSQTFDRETIQYYDIVVKATDQGTSQQSVERTVRVELNDYNDNTPTFSQNIYTYSFGEDTTAATSLLVVPATDADITAATLTYTLETSSTPSAYSTYFELDGTTTNQINLKAAIDLDSGAASSYRLVIKVSDGGTPELTSTCEVVMTVTYVNQHSPVFALTTVTASVNENAAEGDTVTTMVATDADSGDTLTHSITAGNSANKFLIDPDSGVISVAGSLDYESGTVQYVLTVTAVDAGTNAVTGTVTVDIADINDVVPSCSPTSYTTTMSETAAVAYGVATLSCSSGDSVDSLTYTITSGNTGGHFTVSGAGAVTLATVVDYDAGETLFALEVTVSDGTFSTEVPITVSVQAVNEATPAFPANLDVTFAENTAVGTVLATHVATDADAAPHDVVRYEISSVTNSGASWFNLDQTTGTITLAKTLDYETGTSYVITVLAIDGGTPTANTGTGTVTVQVSDVNDVAPTCTPASHVVSIPENTAPSTVVIADLGCSDTDTASLTYSISVTPAHFDVDDSGAPVTLIVEAASILDYETNDAYSVTVTVNDGSQTATINIDIVVTDVNDGGPTFSTVTYSTTISESLAVGQSVETVIATDPDSITSTYGQLIFSILSGNTDSKFIIDSSSGKISVAGVLNADTTSAYVLIVQAIEDAGTNSATATVSITVTGVNDNAPTCTEMAFSITMAEEGTAGDTLRTLTCSDVDGDTLTYTMTNGDPAYFDFIGTSLQLVGPIDYDTAGVSRFDVTIQVSDGTNSIDVTGSVTVTGVNENNPAFTQVTYTVSKAESTSPGSLITTVTATDGDLGESIAYSWVTATTDFTLDVSSGEILLASTLDRETTSSYSLEVAASDGTNSVTATVALTVTDVNDNTPIFASSSYTATLLESASVGDAVVTVVASDADSATNNYGVVEYSIVGGNAQFSIGSATGAITTAAALDYETAASHVLYIKAVDSSNGAGALSSTAVVTVTVSQVNEGTPTFTTTNYAATVDEDLAVGTSMLQVVASDTDAGDDGVVTYSFVSPQTLFYVDPSTGDITLKSALNYETATSHTFEVVAIDSAASPLSSTATIVITVNDINDNVAICSPSLQIQSISENTALTTSVASVACTDADSGVNGAISYSIITINGAVSSEFTIDASTGQVDLAQLLDYETTTEYAILVRVEDGGTPALSATATVNVKVTDFNEAAPTFSLASYTATISETTATGTNIVAVAATDTDTANTITFSISPASSEFAIDSSAGTIYTIATLDYDTTTSYTITVYATDDGTTPSALSSIVSVTITVTDANDITPVFSPGVYSASISENDVSGTTVTTVTATDGDDPTLSYSLVNDFGIFAVDLNGGIITINTASQDYDSATQSYTLVVHAVDGASNTGTTTVHVAVTNYNEHTPAFATAAATPSVDENTAIGTQIVDVDATDADSGVDGNIVYSISSVTAGYDSKFAIDPSSGIVTLAGTLDMESVTNPINLDILATDEGTNPGALTATFSLTVTVTDVNDNTPVCGSSLYSATISEDVVVATTVATIACSDADSDAANNVVSYTFTSNPGTMFSIDATGAVTTTASLDRETTASYTLVIEASDSGGTSFTATTTLTVILTDVNDNTPAFAGPYSYSQAEDTALGTTIVTMAATDTDDAPAGTLTYSIQGGNTEAKFAIDSSTGALELVSALDFETTASYEIEVIATDNLATIRTGTTTVTITVTDVNDITPSCAPAVQTFSLAEDTALLTNFANITCTDSDTGASGTLTYVIATVDGIATAAPFDIDSSLGFLKVNTALDYEADTYKTIIIHAIDGGTTARTGTATVNVIITDINEFTPVFQSTPYTASVSEAASVGDSVYQVAATDQDPTNTVTYVLNPTSTVFDIDTNSGELFLIASLDAESVPTYSVVVEAIDDGSPATTTATATITVTVTNTVDEKPVFNPSVYVAQISETDPVGTTVTTVTATDSDAGTTLTYSILSGNADAVFRIEASGVVAIDAVGNLDYDSATKSYTVVVQASDGTNVGTATVNIEVTAENDNDPVFASTSSTQTMAEDTAVGHTIVTVAATDADHGIDGQITYSISAGNADGRFAVDPSSGEVTLAGSLDRESTANYAVTLLATDGGTTARTATYILTVTVTDVNDVTPQCSSSLYSSTVAENVAASTSIAQLACTDSDAEAPNNNIASYTIVSGNTGTDFAVSATGEVTNANTLNRETTAAYTLVIRVIDGGTAALTTSTTLAITVTDVNDNTPAFLSDPYSFSTAESTAVGSVVGTVVATDADTGDAGTITYSINSGNTDNKVSIDPSTGELKIAATLDFETASNNPYVLQIDAIDNDATAPLTGTTTVSLIVTDSNDNEPSCSPAFQSLSVPESTAASSTVATLTCTDSDTTPNSDLSYTIVSINGAAGALPFAIDASGVITLDASSTFDFETTSSYRVLIDVNDGGTPSLTFTATVNVEITDVNEQAPVFQSTPYTFNFPETTAVGTSMYVIAATDADTADTISYSLSGTNTYFDVDPNSGIFFTIATVDYDTFATPKTITLTVVATDDGTTPQSVTETVTVTVTDANDGVPSFNPGVYAASIIENEAVGYTVVTVTVSDLDDTSWTMSFSSGNADNVFRVDANGDIVVNDVTNFDYDSAVKSYLLVVEAVDAGSNTGTTTVALDVTGYNEDTPALVTASAAVSIAENAAVGTSVADFNASDTDHGNDGVVTFSISSVTNSGTGLFAIDPTSGEITVSGSLDRESQNTYDVTVMATDAGTSPGALSSTSVLTVTVTDENDHTPVCTSSVYSASVAEDTGTGVSVGQLTCSDSDATAPNNDITTYNIISGNTSTVFTISASGEVTTSGALDRETLDNYALVIDVVDSGTPALTTTTTLTITVTDINDNTPVFATDPYNYVQDEDIALGTTVGTVVATDADTGAAGTLVYSIISGDTDSRFTIGSTTGEIILTDSLDYDTATLPYSMLIHAIDSDPSTPLTGTTTVIFNINDKNDNTPACSPAFNTVTFAEDTTQPTTLYTLVCTDADSGTFADLTYTIISVNAVLGTGLFSVDTSGAVRLVLPMDYETTTLHTILITVHDNDAGTPSLTTTATLNVAVTDVNDNTPAFDSLPYSTNVIESTAVGTSVFQVTAHDDDVGDVVSFYINPTVSEFNIDPSTGDISLQAAVDFDTAPTSYEVVVFAIDNAASPASSSATVTLAITNFNDGTPEFTPGFYATTLREDSADGTTVLTVTVTDADDTTFTYNIDSGNTDNIFSIIGTATTADILVNDLTNLDYDSATQSYSLVISAQDGGGLSGSATVAIQVTNYNEHPPALASTTSSPTIPENSATGTSVADVDATDADFGTDGDITYVIVSGASGKFSIDPSTGVVTVSGSLDHESVTSYTVIIDAVDGGVTPSALSAQYTLNVAISDLNDHEPVCSSSLYSASLSEDAAAGTSVSQITCPDADSTAPNNDVSTFAITNGNTGGEFLISNTGEVTTAAVTFDRETTQSYELEIVATDSGTTPSALSTTTTLTITVTDVNDNTPVFSLTTYNVNINENTAIYTSIGAVAATDADSGLAGSIVYTIVTGNGDGKFAVDRTSGDLQLVASVDYETNPGPYVLTVHAIDKEATFLTGTATMSITINDVNDNDPSCTASLYTGTVAEDAVVGTSVATVVCTDVDTVGTAISYSITSAHTEFSIDPTTGEVTTATALDIETTSSYSLTVQATDGSFTASVTVSITVTNVNDNTPAFSPAGPYALNMDEEVAIGYTVTDIDATDADSGTTSFIYSITAGNADGKFVIGTSSGIIQTQAEIDRDNPLLTSYTLTLEVADGTAVGSLTATTSIVISINDLNDNYPSCDAAVYSTTVAENTATSTTVLTPVCSDLDVSASPTLLYSITAGNGDNKFQINTGTGALILQDVLDYETTTSYSLTITVDDQATSNLVTTLSATIYVDPFNENTPVFTGTPYDVSITESVALGYQVVRISATDADTGSTHGTVRYSISSGNGAGHFSIDSSTGWIITSSILDRESVSSYSLTVDASDMIAGDTDAKTASDTFVITIQDVNDNYPIINPASYAVTVNEDASGTSASIVQVSATDDDDGLAASLTYSIVGGNTGNPFSMSTSWVVISGNVDAATTADYVLTVRVSDQGTPALSASTIVSITVIAVNSYTPTFTTGVDTISVPENEIVGTSVYQAAASDADTGDYGELRYYLISGITGNEFSVDLFDGTVRVANALDYDTGAQQYTIVIEVEDTDTSTANTQTATMTLTVDLTDVNDLTPTFTLNTYTASLDENVATGTSVLTITATDSDSGTNGQFAYSIVSGTGMSVFSVDSSTGEITTAVTTLDYETTTMYDLTVQALDSGIPALSSSCLVRITITDLNDNTPSFTVPSVAVTLSEDVAVSTSVATAVATDDDSSASNNNIITYSFSAASGQFVIDPTTGVITTSGTLDRETSASHTLIIHAVDGGTPVNTGTATYTVVVSDINDNAPVVTGTYDTTISEHTAVNTVVFTLVISDADENENSVLTYSFTAGNTDTDFYLDSGSGLIQVRNSLDRERTQLYTLEVTIVDNGTPQQTTIMSATVTISDENDNNPIFQPDPTTTYTFSVSENVPIGTLVDRVTATDLDSGTNGAVTYAVAYYTTGSNTHFTLDPATGDITTASVLDRETQDTYVFVVRASDGGTNTLTASATVSITLDDYNDNIPSFSSTLYTANTDENSAAGTSILTIVIDDLDINVNDDITLSINTTSTEGARADLYIAADSSTYILSVKTPIDRETDPTLNFILIATDGGTPPLSFTTSVEITVGDLNDNSPVFSPTFYNAEIPYNDNCQLVATTLTATDADDGVNAVLTYYFTQNNSPHLFGITASTGEINLLATAGEKTGYVMYAAAYDGGIPQMNTSTGATIRVDTYNPTTYILNYYMSISSATYLAGETTFLSQLTTVYQQTYATSEAKRWCVTAITTTSCVVRIYVIKDDTADDVSELTNDKIFLTMDEAYAVTAKDTQGTPADVITGISWTSYAITLVERYYIAQEEDTPWIESDAGIITVSVLSAVGFIALVLGVAAAIYYSRSPRNTGRNRVEISDEVGDSRIAKKQFQARDNRLHNKMIKNDNEPMFRSHPKTSINNSTIKPYDKNLPPPAVVALPMPSATKKFPAQINQKTLERTKDVNMLHSPSNGPTLMKKPEKLRRSSPVPTETSSVQARRLKPAHKPPSPQDLNNGPHQDGDEQDYMVINREFDGRAIDPITGRLYEYNTRTKERRFVTTPSGQPVTLTPDKLE